MTPEFIASRHISFDYKSTVAAVLSMLQGEFGYPCLLSDGFEELIDEQANEIADQCFNPVAGHIADAQLGLWQIDFYEDTHYLAVVPHVHVEAFKDYWSEGFRIDPDFMDNVKPKLRQVAAPPAGKARAPAAKKITLVADSMRFAAEPEIDVDRAVVMVRDAYSDDKSNGKFIDFSVWPPRDAPLPTREQDRDFGALWSQVYQDGPHNVWMLRERAPQGKAFQEGTFRLAHIDSMSAWSPRWLGGGASTTDSYPKPLWMDGSFMHLAYCPEGNGRFSSAVVRIADTACEQWYQSRKRLNLFPFPDAARCLIVEGETRLAIAEGPVTDADFFVLPKPLCNPQEGVIALDDGVVVYFTRTKRYLMMHRLQTRTMRHARCLLDGFGHSRMIDGQLDAGFGNVQVCKGHGDWWIFNHHTNAFGTSDVAMFWNAKSDETFKIGARDVGRGQPTIIYQRALGRYLGLQHRSVSLLVAFETIYDSKEKRVLEWTTV